MSNQKLDFRPTPLPHLREPATARPKIWPLLALVVGVGALSLTLMPSGDELVSLSNANDQRSEREVKLLEAQVAAGERTAHTIGSLARARLWRGDADGGIALLSEWITERPDDLSALKFLADASRSANRKLALIDALERLQRHQPLIEREGELAALYAAVGTPPAEAPEHSAQSKEEIVPKVGIASGAAAISTPALETANDSSKHKAIARLERPDAKPDAVLEAQNSLRLGDRGEALRWGEVARDQSQMSPLRLLQLARVYEQLAKPTSALEILRRSGRANTDPVWLAEYARLFIVLGHPDEGLGVLEAVKLSERGTAWQESWALLATSAGQGQAVSKWLANGGGAHASVAFHRDLVHLAMAQNATDLAVASSAQLIRSSVLDADRATHIDVLLAARRAPEALPHLNVLRQHGMIDANRYREVLEAGWRAGAPVAADLRLETVQFLNSGLEPMKRDTAIALLQDLGAFSELVQVLESLAEADPQRWLGAFTEAAERSGKQTQLEALWRRLGDAPSTPATLRSQVAFRLLEAGDKTNAEHLFRSLAASTGPDHPATRQLLFVWGPRPLPVQLDWLEFRASTASGKTKASWLRLLAERGGTSRVLQLRKSAEPPDDDEDVVAAYLDTAASTGDKTAVRMILMERAAQTRSLTELVRLARHASAIADIKLQRQLIEATIAAGSQDPELRHTLGLLAYRERDWGTAERWLNLYNLASTGSYETHRLVGEVKLLRRDLDGARRSFENALERLEQTHQSSHPALVARASLLQRVGRTEDARAQYENLLAQRPRDDDIRADYASMMMSLGDSKSAQRLLDEREK